MTKRIAKIRRSAGAGPMSVFHEIPSAQYVRPWVRFPEMSTRRFWQSVELSHGQEITAKVREATPGCRPGFLYLAGRLPPLPLLEQPPAEHPAASQYVEVDGERLWWCGVGADGRRWLPCQAEHLRSAGEVDGQEWRDYLRWRDSGFPSRYRVSGGNRTVVSLWHVCF